MTRQDKWAKQIYLYDDAAEKLEEAKQILKEFEDAKPNMSEWKEEKGVTSLPHRLDNGQIDTNHVVKAALKLYIKDKEEKLKYY